MTTAQGQITKPSKATSKKLLGSTGCMQTISEFLTVHKFIAMNLVNRQFYDRIIPEVMTQRKLYPNIDPQMHLFIYNQQLWGVKVASKSTTLEIDFEDDKWFHDNQHEFDEKGHQWPEMLIDFKEIGQDETDPQLKIGQKEDVLIQYCFQVRKDKFLIFPLTDTVNVTRGLFIELGDKHKKEKMQVTKTSPAPRELIRPGVCPQKTKGLITDMLFAGGNEEKRCHSYNIEKDVWTEAGVLPNLHTVTEQIMLQYNEKQTITLFVQINFENNCFQMNSAVNKENVRLQASSEEWKWLCKLDLDTIQNFHIKNAFFFEDKLVIFARGQPRNVIEVCCSFFLIFNLVIEGGNLVSVDPDYRYIKLDPLSYAEFQSRPQVTQSGDNLMIRMPQEDNHAEGFPRELLEFTIPNTDFTKDDDLNAHEQNYQKLITIEFKEKSASRA